MLRDAVGTISHSSRQRVLGSLEHARYTGGLGDWILRACGTIHFPYLPSPARRASSPALSSSASMGKQKEELRDQEKDWLELQYASPDVQILLRNKQSKTPLKDATDKIFPDYQIAFAGPIPAEPLETFTRRVKNAKKAEKDKMFRKPAEKEEEVPLRLAHRYKVCQPCSAHAWRATEGWFQDIQDWFKRRQRKAKRDNKEKDESEQASPVPSVPPLTPQRRARGVGALELFAESPLRREVLMPVSDKWTGVGDHRHQLAQAFRGLKPELQAAFEAQAREKNVKVRAQELEEAGSSAELARGL